MLLKVKIGDEKVIELSRDIKHFMQCLNLILDYLMTVSIKKQILILILAAFSLNGACGMLDPKVDAAVKGLSPLNWPLTVNDLELWNKENLVVAKNEKELLAHYMRYYHAKSSSLKMNSMMDFYLASGDILFRVWHLIHFINKKYLYLMSPIIIVLIWSIFIFCTVFLAAMLGPLILKKSMKSELISTQ